MKNILAWIGLCTLTTTVMAQNRQEVLSYGLTDLNGTARYQSMSGAFTALGGDISALQSNPASSAVFNRSSYTITGSNYHNSNAIEYFGSGTRQDSDRFELNQVGAVIVFINQDQNSPWKKVNFGISYELHNNFRNDYRISGRSSQSIDQYFIENANGFTTDQIGRLPGETYTSAYADIGQSLGYAAQQGFLGYEAFVIDPTGPGANSYTSNASYSNGVQQEQWVNALGRDDKLILNMGAQYEESLYLGASLNLHNIDRTRASYLDEYGYNPNSTVQYLQFDNELYTFGNGVSFDLGAIWKLNEAVRFGFTYHSPTWYNLQDEIWQGINTDILDQSTNQVSLVEVYPDVIQRFQAYDIRIPSRLGAGIAVVFAKNGLFSADYSYQDYSNAKLRPTSDAYFSAENAAISAEFQAVSSLRLGGEYKLGPFSLRGGYRLESSPYQDGATIGELTGYSVGAGYFKGHFRLDLGYSHAERDQFINLYDNGFTPRAFNNYSLSNFNVTVGFNL